MVAGVLAAVVTKVDYPSPVQALIGQLFGFSPQDEAKLADQLFEESVDDYAATLVGEAQMAGYPVSFVSVKDVQVLDRLRQRAEFAAQSIARTYNEELKRQIVRIAEDNPRANRRAYARQLEDWDKGRMQRKVEEVAVTEQGWAMHEAKRDFAANNPGLTGIARVMPEVASEPICEQLLGLGEMPLEDGLRLSLPAHPHCVHWLEIAWACDMSARKAWAEPYITKVECPTADQLWLGGDHAYVTRDGPDAAAWLDALPGVESMSDDEVKVRTWYMGLEPIQPKAPYGGYKSINGYLRTGKVDRPLQEVTQKSVVSMDAIIGRGQAPADAIVFRGLKTQLNPAVGDVLTDRGFMSTSLKRETAEMFATSNAAGSLMEIRVPKGMPVAKGVEGDAEVILPRSTSMRVLGVTDRSGVQVLSLEVIGVG